MPVGQAWLSLCPCYPAPAPTQNTDAARDELHLILLRFLDASTERAYLQRNALKLGAQFVRTTTIMFFLWVVAAIARYVLLGTADMPRWADLWYYLLITTYIVGVNLHWRMSSLMSRLSPLVLEWIGVIEVIIALFQCLLTSPWYYSKLCGLDPSVYGPCLRDGALPCPSTPLSPRPTPMHH